jgi:hypothetical protein
LSRLEEGRLVSPSAERNKGPVAEVLKQALPDRALCSRSEAELVSTLSISREKRRI